MSVPTIPRLAAVLVLSGLVSVPFSAQARGVTGVALDSSAGRTSHAIAPASPGVRYGLARESAAGHDFSNPGSVDAAPSGRRPALPDADMAYRLVDVVPDIVWEEGRCAAQGQEPPDSRRMPKVIGWLYRWVRGFDVERSITPAPQLYLRSPLLAGFNETVNCPVTVVEPRATTCVAVTASDGREHLATYLITLPHQGARTPADLQAMLRKRLGEGERVPLRTLAGGWIELDPKTALEIQVKACGSEIG